MGPSRLYVVIGDPREPWDEPPYATDPRHYGLPIFDRPVSDEEFDRAYRHRVRAFPDRGDAIRFAWSCGMVSVECRAYDRTGAGWAYNDEETAHLAEDISAY